MGQSLTLQPHLHPGPSEQFTTHLRVLLLSWTPLKAESSIRPCVWSKCRSTCVISEPKAPEDSLQISSPNQAIVAVVSPYVTHSNTHLVFSMFPGAQRPNFWNLLTDVSVYAGGLTGDCPLEASGWGWWLKGRVRHRRWGFVVHLLSLKLWGAEKGWKTSGSLTARDTGMCLPGNFRTTPKFPGLSWPRGSSWKVVPREAS